MNRGKVLFVDQAHPFLPEQLEKLGFDCDFRTSADLEELKVALPACVGMVVRSRISVDDTLLRIGKKLKFIARYGVGLEHIDLKTAKSLGIKVFNSPEGSKDTVAEHAMGLFLNLMNFISRSNAQVNEGEWLREPNRGSEIKGRTVGILGCGNLGYAFAKRLAGFDARVVAYDKYKSGFSDQFVEEVDLDTFFKVCDLVSIHIPYSEENHYYIDKAFLDAFEKPIYLVNTARGLVLNTRDLVQALDDGKVLGAGIDVIEYEASSFVHLSIDELPEPFQRLRQMDNVILTPHIAGWSHEAKRRHAVVLAQKIEAYFNAF